MVFVFVVDSAVQSSPKGRLSPLDISKNAVESFLSTILRLQISVPLMLFETGSSRDCLLANVGDPLVLFEQGLKNINQRPNRQSGDEFSYPISTAFSIMHKYRIKNQTDKFGHGRCPWIAAPVNLIILTDGKSLGESDFKLPQFEGPGAEFLSDRFRWDHRIFCLILEDSSDGGNASFTNGQLLQVPKSLTDLCYGTGGEVVFCNGIRGAQTVLRNLALKLSQMSVDVKFASDVESSVTLTGQGAIPQPSQLTRLVISGAGEWPIPESFWVSQVVEHFPPRTRHPVLSIMKNMHAVTGGVTPIPSPSHFLNIAKELDIHMDCYELATPMGSNLTVRKNLGISKEDSFHVCVKGSGPTAVDAQAMLNNAGGLMIGGGIPHTMLSGAATSPPFAILLGGPTVAKLVVMPYNYPVILPLMHRAWEALRAGAAAGTPPSQLQQQPWAHLWRQELSAYLWSVPMYYYGAVQGMLNRAGLKALAQLQNLDTKLHKKPYLQFMKALGIAEAAIISLEAASRTRWPKPEPSPVDIAISSCVPSKRYNIPQNIRDIAPQDMLATWETMRSLIFGGSGLTVAGLSVKGVAGSGTGTLRAREILVQGGGGRGGATDMSEKRLLSLSEQKEEGAKLVNVKMKEAPVNGDWLLGAIGGGAVVQQSCLDMGKYMHVLAAREALRDPLLKDPPKDENELTGLMNRKLTVHFGNRYRKSAKDAAAGPISELAPGAGVLEGVAVPDGDPALRMAIEIEGIHGERAVDAGHIPIAPPLPLGLGGGASGTGAKTAGDETDDMFNLQVVLDSAHQFFMDTPAPHRDDEGEDGDDERERDDDVVNNTHIGTGSRLSEMKPRHRDGGSGVSGSGVSVSGLSGSGVSRDKRRKSPPHGPAEDIYERQNMEIAAEEIRQATSSMPSSQLHHDDSSQIGYSSDIDSRAWSSPRTTNNHAASSSASLSTAAAGDGKTAAAHEGGSGSATSGGIFTLPPLGRPPKRRKQSHGPPQSNSNSNASSSVSSSPTSLTTAGLVGPSGSSGSSCSGTAAADPGRTFLAPAGIAAAGIRPTLIASGGSTVSSNNSDHSDSSAALSEPSVVFSAGGTLSPRTSSSSSTATSKPTAGYLSPSASPVSISATPVSPVSPYGSPSPAGGSHHLEKQGGAPQFVYGAPASDKQAPSISSASSSGVGKPSIVYGINTGTDGTEAGAGLAVVSRADESISKPSDSSSTKKDQQKASSESVATASAPAATGSTAHSTDAVPLPPGWVRHFSNRLQREYWFNAATGKSVWEPPTE